MDGGSTICIGRDRTGCYDDHDALAVELGQLATGTAGMRRNHALSFYALAGRVCGHMFRVTWNFDREAPCELSE